MSSYYPSFSYMEPNGKKYNSFIDKNLIVVHFESGDSDEVDTFLSMEPVYSDNAYGTKRFDYGARYRDVAVIRISVMKANGEDFTVAEVRDFLRWTTGARKISYLDLSDIVQYEARVENTDEEIYETRIEEVVAVSFLGRITSVYQQKLDGRTVGFVIEHTSISPYGYSPIQSVHCPFWQKLSVNTEDVLIFDERDFSINDAGMLNHDSQIALSATEDGVAYLDNSLYLQINNYSDDLSDYVYMDTVFTNSTSDKLIIKNETIYQQSNGKDGVTEISGVKNGETITLNSGQFVVTDSSRMLGNNFNFVWPKLVPGVNDIIISGSGNGVIDFSYRYPIKIGDCAMNIDVYGGGLCCGDHVTNGVSEYVTWNDIIGKPNTRSGYNLTDVYTMSEIDYKINNMNMSIDEEELNEMLEDVFEQ